MILKNSKLNELQTEYINDFLCTDEVLKKKIVVKNAIIQCLLENLGKYLPRFSACALAGIIFGEFDPSMVLCSDMLDFDVSLFPQVVEIRLDLYNDCAYARETKRKLLIDNQQK